MSTQGGVMWHIRGMSARSKEAVQPVLFTLIFIVWMELRPDDMSATEIRFPSAELSSRL